MWNITGQIFVGKKQNDVKWSQIAEIRREIRIRFYTKKSVRKN